MLDKLPTDEQAVLCLWSSDPTPMLSVRAYIMAMMNRDIRNPVILVVESPEQTIDEQLIHFSAEAGALFLDGMGDGIWLKNHPEQIVNKKISGRTYLKANNNQRVPEQHLFFYSPGHKDPDLQNGIYFLPFLRPNAFRPPGDYGEDPGGDPSSEGGEDRDHGLYRQRTG